MGITNQQKSFKMIPLMKKQKKKKTIKGHSEKKQKRFYRTEKPLFTTTSQNDHDAWNRKKLFLSVLTI